jgi:hypothetical protein
VGQTPCCSSSMRLRYSLANDTSQLEHSLQPGGIRIKQEPGVGDSARIPTCRWYCDETGLGPRRTIGFATNDKKGKHPRPSKCSVALIGDCRHPGATGYALLERTHPE